MIKAEDLMIGNYLHYELTSGKLDLVQIKAENILRLQNKNPRSLKRFKPIPLTEQWLKDLGFKFQKCGISGADMWQGMDFWHLKYQEAGAATINITMRGTKRFLPRAGVKLAGYINSEYKYVHQIQNLHKSLTGKELNKL